MLALIDGDVIAHMSCKSRFSKPSHNQDYTELHQMVENCHDHQFSKAEDKVYLEESWTNFQKRLDEVLEQCFAEDYLMAVKSSVNYRDELYPIEFGPNGIPVWGYKANRWKPADKSNHFVPVMRKLAIHEGLAIEAYGREADDLLRMWAEQAMLAGDPYVIVSIDKDLKCIPGKHYNIKTKELSTVTPRDAMRFFYQQLLSGDTTDNIPGVPGIGPKKSEAFLLNLHEEEEMQEIIVEMYMSAYEENWYEMLLSNGKLLYLQKHEDDHFCCSTWPVVAAMGVECRYNAAKLAIKPPVVTAVQKPPPAPVLSAPAPTAPSLIPRPSPSPKLALAPKPVQPEAVPDLPWETSKDAGMLNPTLSFKIPPLKGSNGK